MLRVNSSSLFSGAVILTALILLSFSPGRLNPIIEKKMNAAIETAYNIQDFQLQWIDVDKKLIDENRVEFGAENLFAIFSGEGNLIGYGYLGRAPSMKNIFDYLILFEPDLKIKKAKVLIYREDYGRQIGSQRWLKKFLGRAAGEQLEYGQDVDAITGATISAKSMTRAVNDVLHAFDQLKSAKIL